MDVMVSSCTPTPETLLKLHIRAYARGDPKILAVSQPSAPGQSCIPGTKREAEIVHSIFPHATNILNRSQGIIKVVLEGMKRSS